MNKLLQCLASEPPSVTIHLNCQSSCCKSRMSRTKKDLTDGEDATNKERDESVCCCCFRVRRHANITDDKKQDEENGRDT